LLTKSNTAGDQQQRPNQTRAPAASRPELTEHVHRYILPWLSPFASLPDVAI
jgi:hypothetical protein